jgi:hypothetical protein
MYPTPTQLDDLCTLIKPSFPQMDIHEQTEMRYRIRDAYHLVTTGAQAPVWPDELDVKDALPQLQAQDALRTKAAEEKRLKEKEIQNKLDEAVAKIDELTKQAVAKAEAEKADVRAKADAEKVKLEAEAQKAAEALDKKNGPAQHTGPRKG